jgi:hypothetical protein
MHKVQGGSTPSSMQAALLDHFGGSQQKLGGFKVPDLTARVPL